MRLDRTPLSKLPVQGTHPARTVLWNNLSGWTMLQVGYADDNCSFVAGLDDVRDGLSGGLQGKIRRIYEAEGNNLETVRASSCII